MPSLTTRPSRRERAAKPALTREGIISAAVQIMRDEGLERVTMRRLAAELDTGPASLYVYVRNAAELHAGVLDELLGLVGLAPEAEPDRWRESVVAVLLSYSTLLFTYPDLARSALVARPSGPNYLALVERLLSLQRQGGTPDAQAAWGVDLLLLFATSIALEHGTRQQTMENDADIDALREALLHANAVDHPSIAALGHELLSGAPDDRYEWHVRSLLAGIAVTALPPSEGVTDRGRPT